MPKHRIKIVVQLLALVTELRAHARTFAMQPPCSRPQAASRGLPGNTNVPLGQSDAFTWMRAGGVLTAARAASGM